MAEPVVIGYGQNKWVKDANTKMVFLTTGGTAVSNTVTNLETADAGQATSSYTIPAGKKFVLLWLRPVVYSGSSKEGFFLYESYGGVNYVKARYGMNLANTNGNALWQGDMETYMEFQAGSTISIVTFAAAMSMSIFCIGVETDV